MNCKFCNAELEPENSVCPVCGKDNGDTPDTLEDLHPEEAAQETIEIEILEDAGMPELEVEPEGAEAEPSNEAPGEEPAQKPKKKWKIVVAVAACVVLVLAAAAAVWYGINDGWKPRENDLTYKASYTADEDELRKNSDTVVATLGASQLTNAQLQIYYWMDFYDFLDYYGSYAVYYGMDYTQPLDEQFVSQEEGLTWQHYFLDGGLSSWYRYAAMCQEAEAAGFQLNEELCTQLDSMPEQMEEMAASSGYASAQEMLQKEMGPGATVEAYVDYLNTYYTAGEYFNSVLAERTPTDDQIEAYYAENEETFINYGIAKDAVLVDVRHILVYPEGATDESGNTTYSDEDWANCEAEAQEILNQWLAGDATEDSFGELANTYSEDPGSNTNGGLYTDVYAGQMVDTFDAWCFDEARQPGDYGLVRTSYGYHVMYFVGSEASNEWYEYAQDQLLTELSSQIIDEAMAKYTLEVNYKKILIGAVDFSTEG